MSRYAKPGQTIEDLKRMISDNGGVKETIYNDKLKVHKDLLKVDMGHEFAGLLAEAKWESAQRIPDYEMLGDGNGQFPVAFVIYIGHEGKLRAYIPIDGNNTFGKDTQTYDMDYGSRHDGGGWLKYERMKNAVLGRISVKGGSEDVTKKSVKSPLTFRQVIQSLRDYEDQNASVMPVAKDAESSVYGIEYIWFDDGVLMLGQHDDEGLPCCLIAERIEECVPSDLLDEVAVVKVGETYKKDGTNIDVITKYGEKAIAHNVKSSEVKPCRYDWFCKWTIKFA